MSDKRTNSSLRFFYDQSYEVGEAEVFTAFENGKDTSEDCPTVLAMFDWTHLTVLDVGSGTGMFARSVAALGASKVIGVDYSASAIEQAESIPHSKNVEFVRADVMNWAPLNKFDVIVSLGTLEHLDKPAALWARISQFLADDGTIIVACPHFLNPRGYVWIALATLLDVPMSLSDLHFIHPWHMKQWATESGLTVELIATVDHESASGRRLLRDYEKRLHNALRDAKLSTDKVNQYMDYLENLVEYLSSEDDRNVMDGATALYRFRRN